MSGRSEHRFTSQRTSFEGPEVVADHVHDIIYELLEQTHTPIVDRSRNQIKIDGLKFLHCADLCERASALLPSGSERSRLLAECLI